MALPIEGKALKLLLEIEERLSQQVNVVLHSSSFQKIEASWRGLKYLVCGVGHGNNVKIKMLNVSWKELSHDLHHSIDFDQSQFFKKVYTEQFDQPGGEAFGLLIGDYSPFNKGISSGSNDILTLKLLSGSAAAAFSVFVIGISPGFFGIDHFHELLTIRNLNKLFVQPEYISWKGLQSFSDSKFLGIILSPFCLRWPYKKTRSGFQFEETITSQRDYLWGNGVYAYASVVINSFKETGLFFTMKGFSQGEKQRAEIRGLPSFSYDIERESSFFSPFPFQVLFPFQKEAELNQQGFITATASQYTTSCSFYNSISVYGEPNHPSNRIDSPSAILASNLQNVLSLSRFAHYIKVIGRDKIGSLLTPQECQTFFERWLALYTSKTSSDIDESFITQYPLYEYSVSVKEFSNKPGTYACAVQLKTHPSLNNSLVDYVIQLNN